LGRTSRYLWELLAHNHPLYYSFNVIAAGLIKKAGYVFDVEVLKELLHYAGIGELLISIRSTSSRSRLERAITGFCTFSLWMCW